MKTLKIQTTTAILVSLFFLVGCAAEKKYYHVISHKPRVSTMGFSIEPPPGKGWYERLKNNSLIYLKKTDANKYSLQTKVTEINLARSMQMKNDFVKHVQKNMVKTLLDTRHKNAKLNFFTEDKPSTLCVKYTYQYEDHGYKNLRRNEFVIVKNNGRVCMHPDVPRNGIEISYLEKTLSSSKHRSYIDEGEKFLDSLSFRPVTN